MHWGGDRSDWLLAEADPRFGAFDFSAAYEEAPDDLQELLDSHESLVSARTRSLALSVCSIVS